MSKNTEAIICFILFSHQFTDHSYGSYMSDCDKIKLETQNLLKNVTSKRLLLYVIKNTKDIIRKKCFSDYSHGSCPIRLVPTFIVTAKERSLLR